MLYKAPTGSARKDSAQETVPDSVRSLILSEEKGLFYPLKVLRIYRGASSRIRSIVEAALRRGASVVNILMARQSPKDLLWVAQHHRCRRPTLMPRMRR